MNYQILSLPLFQGLSKTELLQIAETIPLAFAQHNKGDLLADEDQPCHQLVFVLNGNIEAKMRADNHSYTLIEPLKSHMLIEPERLFGLNQHFMRTYTAATHVNTLTIKKQDIIKLTQQYVIVQLNLLNIIATQNQRLLQQLWHPSATHLSQRIVRFFTQHCIRPAGTKIFKIKMNTLANELNDSRLNISKALNKMQECGLISLTRGIITIPAIEKLTQYTI